ncbi:endonuclease domain-containing 1 protein-like [Xenopus laevis]|uniref:Endonuclease domain-containing 1 protein-like n=1 Tax=Xenopus laevis TaxID=8355 RepID=A0A8J1MNP6_XENLA|nr:endonuclease domain-containing 1 protein-like [Xenopus laevis]
MKMMLSLGWLFIAIVHKAEPLISDNFTDCREYFYKAQLPEGFDGIALPHHFNPSDLPDGIKESELTSPSYICHQYGNKFHFASLYDRGRRIPLYSAYILDKRSSSQLTNKRKRHFNIEPQLVYIQLGGTMQLQDVTKRKIEIYKINQGIKEASEKNDPDYLIRTSQAVDADYRKSGYDRGHVNPRLHHVTADGQNATFTFTNVAPMTKKLNTNIWNQYENKMIGYADGCATMYVVTGIVPGNNWIKGDRVNIPSYVWNAYCCVDNNGKPIKSGAGLKENDISDRPVNEMPINDLQGELKHLLRFSGNIAMFFNNCA